MRMSSHEGFMPIRIPLIRTPVKPPPAEPTDAFPGIQMLAYRASGYRPQPSQDNACSPVEVKQEKPSPGSRNFDSLPEFQRHEESTNIELFYDLFFVANLTTFSGLHEINDKKTLTSYVGFFCVLWFTWCQVTLFDVRFVADSVVDRVTKAVHLGVMVGFAVVGPNFNPTDYDKDVLRTMCEYFSVTEELGCCADFRVSVDSDGLKIRPCVPIPARHVACEEVSQRQASIHSNRRK